MPADMQEKTPGVYVRAENELPHELDLLWSNKGGHHREERSPIIPFVAGVLVGGIITALVFMLFLSKPQVQSGSNEILAPVSGEVGTGNGQPAAGNNAVTSTAPSQPDAVRKATSGATTYTVVSGDTLGGIAGKVYGNSGPEYVEKIQRANNLKSPDDLQLDQKLIIPPKDY